MLIVLQFRKHNTIWSNTIKVLAQSAQLGVRQGRNWKNKREKTTNIEEFAIHKRGVLKQGARVRVTRWVELSWEEKHTEEGGGAKNPVGTHHMHTLISGCLDLNP